MQSKYVNLLKHSIKMMKFGIVGVSGKCINIGCGFDIRPFWLNCDSDAKSNKVREFDITNPADLKWLSEQKFDIITSDHVIGYLTIAQAESFFKACLQSLNINGRLVLEFPDLKKISKRLDNFSCSSENADDEYVEIIRSIYAYDSADALSLNFNKKTYITGWTADYLSNLLLKVGFKKIIVGDPQTHEKRAWRDSRVEAKKQT
jgi:hypothetical protein